MDFNKNKTINFNKDKTTKFTHDYSKASALLQTAIDELSIASTIGEILKNYMVESPELMPENNNGIVSEAWGMKGDIAGKTTYNSSYDLVAKYIIIATQDIIDQNKLGAVLVDDVAQDRVLIEMEKRFSTKPRFLEKEITDAATASETAATQAAHIRAEEAHINKNIVRHRNERFNNHIIALAAGVPAFANKVVDLEPILSDLGTTAAEKKELIYETYVVAKNILIAQTDKYEDGIPDTELRMFSKGIMEASILAARPDATTLAESALIEENKESQTKSRIKYNRVSNYFSNFIDGVEVLDWTSGEGTQPFKDIIVGQMFGAGLAKQITTKKKLHTWMPEGVDGLKWSNETISDTHLFKWHGMIFVTNSLGLAVTANVGIETQQIIDLLTVVIVSAGKDKDGKEKFIAKPGNFKVSKGTKLGKDAREISKIIAKSVVARFHNDRKLLSKLNAEEQISFFAEVADKYGWNLSKEDRKSRKLENKENKENDKVRREIEENQNQD